METLHSWLEIKSLTECPIGMDPCLYGNTYGSISIEHAVKLEEHDTIKMVLQMSFICCTQFF